MTHPATISVFGMYPDFRTLRTSVDVLKSFGFRNEAISVLFPERVVVKGLSFGPEPLSFERAKPLIGDAVGALMRVEAANLGVVSEALVTVGVSMATARGYEDFFRRGELLLGIRSQAWVAAERAEGILHRTGAHHITRTSTQSAGLLHASRAASIEPANVGADRVRH